MDAELSKERLAELLRGVGEAVRTAQGVELPVRGEFFVRPPSPSRVPFLAERFPCPPQPATLCPPWTHQLNLVDPVHLLPRAHEASCFHVPC